MPRCEMTLIANAGLLIRLGCRTILLDALHDRKVEGWSSVTPERLQRLIALLPEEGPDMIIFTHCHPDHYSQGLAEQAAERWPRAALLLPEQRLSVQQLVCGRLENIFLPDLTVRFAKVPHESDRYAGVPHYACMLEHDGLSLLFTGDAKLCAPELSDFVEKCGNPDVFTATFPWITLRRGRKFIQEKIHPAYVVIDHLPFAEDDIHRYRAAARKAADSWTEPGSEILLLTEPFRTVTID